MIQKLKDVLKTILDIENADLILRERLFIPLGEGRRLRKKPHETDRVSVLFGKPVQITNNFWHLHSLKEIFLEEVYKFDSSVDEPVILDCGANIGLSVIYFKRRFPRARVIAFEPDVQVFKKLEANLSALNLSDVELHNKAVWNNETVLDFNSSGDLGGTLEIGLTERANTTNKVTQVSTVRLKKYLESKIDFLKIDIEGAEYLVLADCAESLANVSNIFVEYHSAPGKIQELDELLKILKEAGFRYYIKEAWNNLPYPYMHKNYNPFWDLQLNIFGYRVK